MHAFPAHPSARAEAEGIQGAPQKWLMLRGSGTPGRPRLVSQGRWGLCCPDTPRTAAPARFERDQRDASMAALGGGGAPNGLDASARATPERVRRPRRQRATPCPAPDGVRCALERSEACAQSPARIIARRRARHGCTPWPAHVVILTGSLFVHAHFGVDVSENSSLKSERCGQAACQAQRRSEPLPLSLKSARADSCR